MEEQNPFTDNGIYCKKAYTVNTSIKAANIIAADMENEISNKYPHEYGCGTIKVIPMAGAVKVEVWPDDDDFNDCPWWLLTYHDFVSHCRKIIEANKEELE